MNLTPIPTTIIRQSGTATKFGFFAVIRFLLKHWYIFSLIFFLLPGIILSIKIAKQTNNPSYPFIDAGLSIIGADNQLDKEVNTLKKNPIELTGEKPDKGLWNKAKYYWNLILIYWKIIGLVLLISVPFKLAYTYHKKKGDRGGYESSVWENFRKSIITGFIFIFAVNLILTIVYALDGTLALSFPTDASIYLKSWLVIKNTIPLHGLYNLSAYLISQF